MLEMVAGQDGPFSFSTGHDGPTFTFVNLGHLVRFPGEKLGPIDRLEAPPPGQ